MRNLQNFDYNGLTIQRREDGYLYASQMCLANGKLLAGWTRLKSSKAYLAELSEAMQIPIAELIEVRNGNQSWVHPSIAINLARWISPKFAVWCDAHIFNLMTSGSTSLDIDPIEEMKLKIQLAQIEKDKEEAIAKAKTADLQLTQFRHLLAQTAPEPVQQKVLGYQVVKETEYRDRIIQDDEVIRDGTTMNKTELCKRYGILTKKGKPDYKTLNYMLGNAPLPSEAWKLAAQIQERSEFRREFLPALDEYFNDNATRPLFLGES